MNVEERISLFRDMVGCCHNFYLWVYNGSMDLLGSNCPDQENVRNLLTMTQSRESLAEYAKSNTKPILMTNALGLMWVAVPNLREGSEPRIYVMGPFFPADRSTRELLSAMERQSLNREIFQAAERFLQSLPVISHNRIFEYVMMLYFCVTGEKIGVSDIQYEEAIHAATQQSTSRQTVDVHGTYEMEQEMVRMVREGNLNYRKQMDRLAVTGSMGQLSNGDPDRQMKNAVLVCIVLFSRAAIEGGLSPEIAMTLTDHYFQGVEASTSYAELAEVAKVMQEDFVLRVHRVRTSAQSKAIQECCEYISLHLEDDLTLKGMAQQLKYSEYYLSRKFKQEMGVSFKDYLAERRLSRAKDLLRNNALTVREISERMHFCSPSYFAEQFKAVYGVSPSQWREEN